MPTFTESRPTYVRYYVLAVLCAVTVINYVQRNSIAGLATPIIAELKTDDAQIGLSGTYFFLAYALLQIPCGMLAQRIGSRAALTLFTIGWSICCIGMARSPSIQLLQFWRGMMGIFQAGIFPCATLIMTAWLPPARRAFASGILNSCMLIGGAAVNNLTGFLLEPAGPMNWRMLLAIYSLPGIIWAIGFVLWFRNRPDQDRSVNAAEREVIAAGRIEDRSPRPSIAWIATILSATLWLICVQQFFRAGANRFTDQWLSRYYQAVTLAHIDSEGVRNAIANQYASAPQYAGVIGGLIGGFISDWVLRRTGSRRLARNGVAIVSLILCIACYLPIFFTHDILIQTVLFSLGSFIGSFAAPCAYALTMDVGGRNLPVVFGAMNMVGNFGAAAMTGVVPRINRLTGDWNGSLTMFVGIHVVALACWLVLNPNRSVGSDTQK